MEQNRERGLNLKTLRARSTLTIPKTRNRVSIKAMPGYPPIR